MGKVKKTKYMETFMPVKGEFLLQRARGGDENGVPEEIKIKQERNS